MQKAVWAFSCAAGPELQGVHVTKQVKSQQAKGDTPSKWDTPKAGEGPGLTQGSKDPTCVETLVRGHYQRPTSSKRCPPTTLSLCPYKTRWLLFYCFLLGKVLGFLVFCFVFCFNSSDVSFLRKTFVPLATDPSLTLGQTLRRRGRQPRDRVDLLF